LIAEGLFIVGLDEVQVLAVAKVQLLRNLVRAAGGIAVMIGTSSSISNLSFPDKISSSREEAKEAVRLARLPWSYLIVNYPDRGHNFEDSVKKNNEPCVLFFFLRNSLSNHFLSHCLFRRPDLVLDEDANKFLAHAMEPHGIYGNRPGFIVELALALHGQTDAFPSRLRRLIPTLRKELYETRPHVVNVYLTNQRRLLSASFSEWDEKNGGAETPPSTKKVRKAEKMMSRNCQWKVCNNMRQQRKKSPCLFATMLNFRALGLGTLLIIFIMVGGFFIIKQAPPSLLLLWTKVRNKPIPPQDCTPSCE